MKKTLLLLALSSALIADVLGVYNSVDEDGHVTATWEISEQNGELMGKILSLAGYADDTICDKCKKTYKGFSYAPDASKMRLVGAPLLYGLKKRAANKYESGYIIDPKSGTQYRANAELAGDKLILRGYVGFALIGRTQTWVKASK